MNKADIRMQALHFLYTRYEAFGPHPHMISREELSEAVVLHQPVHLGLGLAPALPLERHEGATGREPIRATDGRKVVRLNSGLAPRGKGVHARSPPVLLLDENLHFGEDLVLGGDGEWCR